MTRRTSSGAGEYGRSAALLATAIGASGLLTYLFFALASHALDRDDYGRIVVLWSVMFVAISVLFRPIEQLLSRTIAELETQRRPVGPALRVAARIQLGIAVVFTVVAVALKGDLEARLFDGSELFFWALVASVLGFGASFFARGYLAGTGRFGLFAALLFVDSIARALFAMAVAVGLAKGVDPIALGIAISPALSVLVPLVAARFGGHSSPPQDSMSPSADATSVEFTLAEGSGFAGAILLVMVSEQVFSEQRAPVRACRAWPGGGRVHLQRADGGASAGGLVPGRRDTAPAPPNTAAIDRQRVK